MYQNTWQFMVNAYESNMTIKNGPISVVIQSIYEERLNLLNRCKLDPSESPSLKDFNPYFLRLLKLIRKNQMNLESGCDDIHTFFISS